MDFTIRTGSFCITKKLRVFGACRVQAGSPSVFSEVFRASQTGIIDAGASEFRAAR